LSRNLILIYFLVVIDSSIAAMVLPIQPQIFAVLAFPTFWVQISNALFRLTQLFSAPFLGYLADKWGRKPVFLMATSGTFFSYLLVLPLNVPAMFANRLFDGASNGFYTAVRSAITDISENIKSLERNLGMLSSLAAIGLILGPSFSALFGLWDIRFLPGKNVTLIIAALFLAMINIVLASAFRETIPAHITKKRNSIATEKFRYSELIPKFLKIWRERNQLGILIIMELLMVSCLSYYFYFINFVTYSQLKFQPLDISYFMIYFGLMIGVVHFTFFKYISHNINKKILLIFCSILGSIALFSYSFVSQKWMLYALVPIDIISVSLMDGIIQGLIGKNLLENERGSVNGLVQGFSGIVAFLSPVIAAFLSLFGVGVPFFWFGSCLLVLFIFTLKLESA
jgi:MFS transporter, DHA1 family, tetracycline resistance protein